MTITPTTRQSLALAFVREFITDHGYAPSLTEVGAGCNVGASAAHSLIRGLEKRGHIRRIKPRIWEVTP
jgi:SOS-response transcriptional repressor LexA